MGLEARFCGLVVWGTEARGVSVVWGTGMRTFGVGKLGGWGKARMAFLAGEDAPGWGKARLGGRGKMRLAGARHAWFQVELFGLRISGFGLGGKVRLAGGRHAWFHVELFGLRISGFGLASQPD